MKARDTLAVTLVPVDCALVEQSLPDFSWPDLSANARYELTRKAWYKQTFAHNAIAYEGKGQVVDVDDDAVNKVSTGTTPNG